MPPLKETLRLAFFSSGEGQLFEETAKILAAKGLQMGALITQNPHSGSVLRAQALGIPVFCLDKAKLQASILEAINDVQPDYLILAGFTRKIPEPVVEKFKNRIFNSHPSLLPKFGGKGMYGTFVHEAVIAAGEKLTGISVHIVSAEYDDGPVIARKEVEILPGETPAELEKRLKEIERSFFGEALFTFFSNSLDVSPFSHEKKPSSTKF